MTIDAGTERAPNAKRPEDEASAGETARLAEPCPSESELIGVGAKAFSDAVCASAASATSTTPEAAAPQTPEAAPAPPPSPTPSLSGALPSSGSSKRFYAFTGAATAAGLALGFLSYPLSGLQGASDARVGAASLIAAPWKSEIASDASEKRQIASLLDELRSMRTQIEAMSHAAESQRAAERISALEASRETALEASRASERATAGASMRIDRLEARLGQLELTAADHTLTGSVQQNDGDGVARKDEPKRQETNAPNSSNAPAAAAKAEAEKKSAHSALPPGDYVLREVSDGIALVERGDGLIEEVAKGDSLPGAGRVTAIERRGAEWVVVTSRGVIDSRRN